MSCAQRVNKLIDGIRTGQIERPDLLTAAEFAGYSPFHFHRLFKEHAGETLQSFSSRTRLARAARLLRANSYSRVLDVGIECGFASAEDFSRAFRRWFGVTPKDAAKGASLSLNPEPPSRRSKPARRWPVRLQTLPAMDVIYTRVFRAMGDSEAIQRALRRLYDWSPGPLIGLGWDDPDATPLGLFIYDAGVVVKRPVTVLEGWMNHLRIPARQYAVMDFQGDLADEMDAFAHLKHSWLPAHRCRPLAGPKLEIFHDERSLCDWNHLSLKLCIPIESA